MDTNNYRIEMLENDRTPADTHLFVSRAFNDWQATTLDKHLQSFGVIDTASGRLRACLTLAGGGDSWSSPVTGAFGGLSLSEGLPVAALDALVRTVIDWLRSKGNAAQCHLRLPPGCFADSSSAILANVLFRAGWTLEHVDLNYHLPVMTAEAFQAQLRQPKRARIRELKKTGVQFLNVFGADAEAVYSIIAENRASRGYPITMNWPSVARLAAAFPERVRFYALRRGSELLAGAICLRVRPDYLYVFYWGEKPETRRESPVLALAEGLIAHCYADSISIMDLGTSTDASTPNEGLIAFKGEIGCVATTRLTFGIGFK